MRHAIRRPAKATVLIVLLGTLYGCEYATDPSEKPLEGVWLGYITRIDGGLSWQFWLREDGQGNVSGTVSRTDFVRIPHPRETRSPGVVTGVHASSEMFLTLEYGESTEVYEGRFRSEDHIRGLIHVGTEVRNIAVLELRRIGRGEDGAASGATIAARGGIRAGN